MTPLALCRLEPDLVERVRARRELGSLIAVAAVWTLLGAALYGGVLGLWRSPLQALYAGVKLPLLLALLIVATTIANAVFAKLVGVDLDTRQSLACSLICTAILATVLVATSPASLLLALATERHGDTLVGQRTLEASVAMRDAELLLAYHTTLIGVAGLLALQRLHTLLRALAGPRATAFFSLWLGVQAFTGTQLSWVLRPYLGKPTLPVQLFRDDALRGSFLEEVGRWLG